jgi:hypothetical protein
MSIHSMCIHTSTGSEYQQTEKKYYKLLHACEPSHNDVSAQIIDELDDDLDHPLLITAL